MPRRPAATVGAICIALTFLVQTTPATASPDEPFVVDATHSSVEFSISKWTVTRQHGIFRDIEGTVAFDPAAPENAVVDLRVRAASLDTRNSTRDKVVRSDDFLDVERHPWITFRSTRIRRDSNGAYQVTGELTIRGVTKRLTAPVQFVGIHRDRDIGELASFETAFVVNRSDFGVLGSRWSGGQVILGDEVSVRLTVVARRAP